MVRYHISVNNGDNDVTVKYYFVHKNWNTISKDESDKAFDAAVKELDRIYKTYGRFATEVGVCRLFESFGFDRTYPGWDKKLRLIVVVFYMSGIEKCLSSSCSSWIKT